MGCPMHSAFTAHSPLPIHPSDKAVRSIMIEPSRTERKSGFQKSLKNFIHKIVNNELSKRSLALIGSSTRVKTTNAHMNASTKRRSRKKTSNRGSKLEGASCLGDIKIV